MLSVGTGGTVSIVAEYLMVVVPSWVIAGSAATVACTDPVVVTVGCVIT